jgi:aspartate/methionine/tyrosine aminotransferase
MVEVCSTTLPQKAIPPILSHPEYPAWLEERITRYEKFSNIAYDILKEVPGIKVNRTNGAFYMSVAFKEGRLNHKQSLPIEIPEVQELVENLVDQPDISPDKRFVYYLLASTGICVVPLSSFFTPEQGFRITLLERDEATFTRIFKEISVNITRYLKSVKRS